MGKNISVINVNFKPNSQLKNHTRKKHEGMRYDDNCEAGFTSPRGLEHHQQIKHDGYSYDCNLCDAKFQRQLL